MFCDTITIYNKYKDGEGKEHYHRSVLENVFWNEIKGSVMRKTGAASSDKVQIIIPERKGFVESEYDGTGWTLKAGDLVIKGDIKKEVLPGETAKALDKYSSKSIITNVDDKRFCSALAHWEVSCK